MTNEELERAVERLEKFARRWPTGSHRSDLVQSITDAEGDSELNVSDILALLSERAELLAAVERMRVALQPFAEVAEEFSVCGDGQPISIKAASGKSDLNVGHLRRAAEAAK